MFEFTLLMFTLSFVLISTGAVRLYFNKIFSSEKICSYQAQVTDIKDSISTGGLVCPYVQYTNDNAVITAHHYIPVFRNSLDLNVGDNITIQVNSKHPKLFRIEDMELYETDISRKVPSFLFITGGSALIIAVISAVLM
ncbi:MAG: hypothetical protein IJM55_05955 [Ruminococcus sp.]|nr:hypothetical protein [Ruminococcus sp.]